MFFGGIACCFGAIAVPLNAEALALITKQVGKHRTHVFSYRGKPTIQVNTNACYAPEN